MKFTQLQYNDLLQHQIVFAKLSSHPIQLQVLQLLVERNVSLVPQLLIKNFINIKKNNQIQKV